MGIAIQGLQLHLIAALAVARVQTHGLVHVRLLGAGVHAHGVAGQGGGHAADLAGRIFSCSALFVSSIYCTVHTYVKYMKYSDWLSAA